MSGREEPLANLELMRQLHEPNETKIVLLVMDGLGGLSAEPGGPTELEAANTPTMDRLAQEGSLGQVVPVSAGITPGSGPAHLALFGYDPLEFEVGRGVIEATGIGMRVASGDVAARGNFCTVDSNGEIVDRRAGRIPTDAASPLVERLQSIELPGVQTEVRVLREYRIALALRGEGLDPRISETDPLSVGMRPLPAAPLHPAAEKTAALVNEWVSAAGELLADQPQANMLTLRGFSSDPGLPQFPETYGLRAGCVAVYPMYRGVASLTGMQVAEFEGETPEAEFTAVGAEWERHDFVFVHLKKADSLGEDGNFDGKVAYLEHVDQALPALLDLHPDVLAMTGDHSTPSRLRYHSWHPVPLLLWAPATIREDASTNFGERACVVGGLGTFPSSDLMPLLMAHALRLKKFGA